MRIGELAAMAGVSVRTVRHYHHTGLLPEPRRLANGYRDYPLADLVRLVRVRRLVDLGLSLDEVADAIADHADLHETLTELDAELAAAQQRIQAQRDRIAEHLAEPQRATVTEELPEQPGMDRERLIAELVEAGEHAAEFRAGYRAVLADQDLTAALLAATRRFDRLADRSPTDEEVAAVAAEVARLGPAIRALLPDVTATGGADLLAAVTAGMPPAQARCLRLMADGWRTG